MDTQANNNLESHEAQSKYKRVLLKISGESLMGTQNFGIDINMTQRIAQEISVTLQGGVEIALVVGGGNIFRGLSAAAAGIERTTADHMGMLATVMNALAIQSQLEKLDVETRVMSAIPMTSICEPYIRRRASRHMERGRVVIFAAGTGNPYLTTDTAAALRAAEMNCEALLKGTKVDGIYAQDPHIYPDAQRYDILSYSDVITQNLQVMDTSAVTLMRDNNIPIIVFSIQEKGQLARVIRGEGVCTHITASQHI